MEKDHMPSKSKESKLEQLQNIMLKHNLSIRAIPTTYHKIVELSHKDQYPDGYAKYFDEFKREMWVAEAHLKHGGQFTVEKNCGVSSTLRFSGDKYYKSLDEIINDFSNEP